jgi:hypothetical protein
MYTVPMQIYHETACYPAVNRPVSVFLVDEGRRGFAPIIEGPGGVNLFGMGRPYAKGYTLRTGHGTHAGAQVIAVRNGRGEADTEELRKAVVHYRALFDELLEVREAK